METGELNQCDIPKNKKVLNFLHKNKNAAIGEIQLPSQLAAFPVSIGAFIGFYIWLDVEPFKWHTKGSFDTRSYSRQLLKHFNTKMSNLNSEEMDTMDYRPDCGMMTIFMVVVMIIIGDDMVAGWHQRHKKLKLSG